MAGLRYQDKVTLITGGSRGIGEGCVRQFVKNGSKVVFCDIQEIDGKQLETEINATGPGEAFFVFCDVTKEDQIKMVIDAVMNRYGRIDCLVNNAGWHPPDDSIDDFSSTDFRNLFELNVMNYFLFCKYSLPYIRKTQGCIINVDSLVKTLGQVGAITYVATKGAISAMTKALAVDEAKYNVRVNGITPSNVWTPLWKSLAEASDDSHAMVRAGSNAQLLGRMGTIEEAGNMCVFIAAEGTFCTGHDFNITGGAELNYANKNRLIEKKNNDE